jgi:hypothetical protein
MGDSQDDHGSRNGTESPLRTKQIHDNLTGESPLGPRDRDRGQDMRSSAIDAGRRAAGANPIRWAGWLIGLGISVSLWVLIYWIWMSI